jgi:hypothetical protein
MKSIAQCFVVFALAAGGSPIHAATYYVATTGNDANSGTSASPWKTVAKAVSTMAAGDTTYVRGGTYNEGAIRFKRSGTQASPIKLLNAPGESPVIHFIDPSSTGYHRIVIQHELGSNKAIGWITIEGFEINNGYEGIKYYNLHDSVIRRNYFNANLGQGILGQGGTRITFDRNIFRRNGDFVNCGICNLEHGLYLAGTKYTITNNLFYDNLSFGIQINGSGSAVYSSSKHPSIEFAGAVDWLVANNTFAYQNYRAGIVVYGVPKDIRIENNIFYENCQLAASSCGNVSGINIGVGAREISIRNNVSYASGSGGTKFISTTSGDGTPIVEGVQYTQSGNIVNVNPGFVNGGNNALPASPNFRLSAQSPALNRGLNLYADGVRTDLTGAARPQTGAFEIGAYEYGASTPPPPPVFNFSLSNGGNKSVLRGGSVTNNLTASLVSGTAQAVSFSASGLPSGVTASFSAASCTPACTTTLSLSASASAAVGGSTITVTAAGGGLSKTTSFSLTVTAPPSAPGPVAHWKFDETSGLTASDASGNGRNATLSTGASFAAGRLSNALSLNGTNGKASASVGGTSAFTYAAWIKPSGFGGGGYGRIMSRESTAGFDDFYFLVNNSSTRTLSASLFNDAGTESSVVAAPNALVLNAWQHVAISYNDASDRKMRVYINGVETSYQKQTALTGTLKLTTNALSIGNRAASDRGLPGLIDDARVYNRALSAAEVLALFNAAPSGIVTDINGDGITNVTDIQIAVNQAAGGAACGSGDANKDGVCNVADVQLVVNRSLGL